jgi:NAD(P)-dependent dehydrogenase (short-subunit alcohol dehydrogenase family)
LVAAGAKVALIDVSDDLTRLKGACEQLQLFKADVTNKASLEEALEHVRSAMGEPYALVNNAALDSPPGASAAENGPFEDYPEDSWDKVLNVNLKGIFLTCQVFGGAMARAGRGSIINISSIYGVVSPDQSIYEYRRTGDETFFKPVAYSASKSGVMNLTRYLATYWAPKVRVNTLTFAGVFNNQDQRFLDGYTKRVPMGRMANEDEYNGAVVFLVSDASSYMTGANVVLDGGWTAW